MPQHKKSDTPQITIIQSRKVFTEADFVILGLALRAQVARHEHHPSTILAYGRHKPDKVAHALGRRVRSVVTVEGLDNQELPFRPW